MAARGLEVVSDTGALTAAVDEAIAANPEIADKIRDGKVAAAGALVGAVMKATRGPGRRQDGPRADPQPARRRGLTAACRAGVCVLRSYRPGRTDGAGR